jgi:hypothetical protein
MHMVPGSEARTWHPSGANEKGRPHRPSDLFAFKAVFQNARLEPGLLPVISLPGGYAEW